MLGHYKTERFNLVGCMNSNWTQNSDNCHLVGGFVFEVVRGIIA